MCDFGSWEPIWSHIQQSIEDAFSTGSNTVLQGTGADGVDVFLEYNFQKMTQV